MSRQQNGAHWRKVAVTAFGAALVFAAWAQENRALVGVVTGVIDGDTIKVQLGTGPVTVRLGHIDAPELNQSGGGAAVRALHGRVLGNEVSLDVVTRDRDERLVAVVFLAGENVNAWMVKQGHAWAYRGHTREADYCAWENAARSLRRGLWASKARDWVAPWDWRETKRDPLYFVTDYSNVSTASCIREIRQTASVDD
jgi:endonuclease YncB( thermonuclease family)